MVDIIVLALGRRMAFFDYCEFVNGFAYTSGLNPPGLFCDFSWLTWEVIRATKGDDMISTERAERGELMELLVYLVKRVSGRRKEMNQKK